jgi:2,3-bisphosphoglycerate-dependent phosphoglycerate mutase
MELYIIRHAQSTNNLSELNGMRQRDADPSLTDLGHQQAAALARYLVEGPNPERIVDRYTKNEPDANNRYGYTFDTLYCSPMHRTLQTASYVATALNLTPHVWVQIHEHGGIYVEHEDERGLVGYPGKTRTEIAAEFPGYILTDEVTEKGWWTGTMEDITEAYGRAIKVAEQLREEAKAAPDKRVAIVSHGTFIGALLKALMNQLPSREQWFWHFNTAMSRIDIAPDGFLMVRYLNRVTHLPPEILS